ncbi:MAG: ABC transporter permease, partial [Gaiellales bacterium]
HVLGALIQTALCLGVVTAVALLLGYRSNGTPADWVATAGLLALFAFALTWLTVALGLVSKSVETASNLPMFLVLLPFLGSGFVPTDTMPAWLRWFAENQPFTPIMNSIRGLLAGNANGHDVLLAVSWSIGIALAGYLWARRLFTTRQAH